MKEVHQNSRQTTVKTLGESRKMYSATWFSIQYLMVFRRKPLKSIQRTELWATI